MWWFFGRRLLLPFLFLATVGGAFFAFSTHDYRTLVLLQNTDEKRATGGFIGSIAVVDHRAWHLQKWQLYDIYESDGQIKEFLPAPPAVQRYLTAGKNELHLSDANWERDFPTSSQNIITLFERAGRPQPDFVVSLNLPVIENLIDSVGGLTFESSSGAILQLNGQNFAALAHQNRPAFYPGDQQKTAFLRPVAQALQKKLLTLSWREKISLLQFFFVQARAHQLYFFSPHPFWQQLFHLLQLTGETQQSPTAVQLYAVESNVSANKSNRLVSRLTNLVQTPASATLSLTWFNDNPLPADPQASSSSRLHYANYQRLLLPPSATVSAIQVDDQLLSPTAYDYRQLIDADGELWQEIGFLVVINEQSTRSATITLQNLSRSPTWAVDFN